MSGLTCPCFCSALVSSDESPYWGSVTVVEGNASLDGTSCRALGSGGERCVLTSEYSLPFCKEYLGPSFCARSFGNGGLDSLSGAAYVEALDAHTKACVGDTLAAGEDFDAANACHRSVAVGACNLAFSACEVDEARTSTPRDVCTGVCVEERANCRKYGSYLGAKESIEVTCSGSYVDPSKAKCSGGGRLFTTYRTIALMIAAGMSFAIA